MTNSDLQTLQSGLVSGQSQCMARLYDGLMDVGSKLLFQIMHREQYRLDEYQAETLVHDTVIDLLIRIRDGKIVVQNFIGYLYKAIRHDLLQHHIQNPNKNHIDVSTIPFEPNSEIDIESEALNEVWEDQLTDKIMDIVEYYLADTESEDREIVLFHIIDVIGNRKPIEKYLYKIKSKRHRELFTDVMAEIKAYLKGGDLGAEEKTA